MKEYSGTVISTKMNKTIVVQVIRHWTHPLYQKTVKRTKKYLVHDEKNLAQAGDNVVFTETKPLSKRKHFTLKSIAQTV